MKVVLFCGGLGMRLKENDESLPKPLVKIGNTAILWHLMKYYAHFGHKDFILCLGYKADLIKQHFLNNNGLILNDFVLTNGGRNVELLDNDMNDWKITFVDTGTHSGIAQRLSAIRRHVEGEERFLANYSDSLTDLHLPDIIDFARKQDTVATLLCVRPNLTYHFVSTDDKGAVTDVTDIKGAKVRINGGYYVFRQEIFDYLKDGEELIPEAFHRLIKADQLSSYRYEGFYGPMDTFKDKQQLEELHARGQAPWEVWKKTLAAPRT